MRILFVFESHETCLLGGNLRLEVVNYRPAMNFLIFQVPNQRDEERVE